MKYLKITKHLAFLGALALIISSCDKVKLDEPLGDKGQKIIGFVDYGGLATANYAKANLAYNPTSTSEILEVHLFMSNAVSSSDFTATIAYDAAALTAYNASVTDPLKKYNKLPDNAYTLATNKVTFKANQTISEPFYVEFHPNNIDGALNFMLTLSVTSLTGAPSGVKIAPGTGTAYLHFIGNPISGFYNETGTRTNYTGSVAWAGPPAAIPAGGVDGTTAAYTQPVFASAIDGQTVSIAMGNGNVPDPAPVGGGAYYYITGNATFSAITYNMGSNFAAGYSNIQTYVVSYTPPSPTVKASFHLMTKYNNTTGNAGNDRLIDQTFVHQ